MAFAAAGNLYFSVIVVPRTGATRMVPWLTWVPIVCYPSREPIAFRSGQGFQSR